tara:strand:- start:969 stop:1316 length:348 start_codon:yes stop_codon:yes gene_type:complete
MTTNSQEWQDARKAWLDKEAQYKKVLQTSTNFYELEKVLYIANHLNPDNIDDENDRNYEFLQEAYSDAQKEVLRVCAEFAEKRVDIEVATNEVRDARGQFEKIKFDELQKSEEVA